MKSVRSMLLVVTAAGALALPLAASAIADDADNAFKDMEKTILQNAHQLEQSNASLEEFAYVASHDLKEPLRKISTFGDRLVASQLDRLSDEGKIYLNKKHQTLLVYIQPRFFFMLVVLRVKVKSPISMGDFLLL